MIQNDYMHNFVILHYYYWTEEKYDLKSQRRVYLVSSWIFA